METNLICVRFHTLWIGGLVLVFFVVCSISFCFSYGWAYKDSLYFAVFVLVDMGFDKLSDESSLSYWILDAYSIVSVPLFAIFIRYCLINIVMNNNLNLEKMEYIATFFTIIIMAQ